MTENQLLTIENLHKQYPGVVALDGVSLSVNRGEVHGLVGANGAGKSTLIKILAGAIQPEKGSIILNGNEVLPLSPRKSQEIGIQVIHQELNLIPGMSVMENIFLGDEITAKKILVNDRVMRESSAQILDGLGVKIAPDAQVGKLTVSHQQMVAVAAALRRKACLLVLDETTAAIAGKEVDHLFSKIHMLREKGLGLIFVSHHIDEIFEICDRVSILRDGKYIATKQVKETSRKEIISLLVGTDVTDEFPKGEVNKGDTILSVQNLTNQNKFSDVSFDVRKGEVVGFFGLVGAGRTELFKTIFGIDRPTSGSVLLHGSKRNICKPSEAVKLGIGFLPEDRKKEGLLLKASVKENITLPSITKITKFGFIKSDHEKKIVNEQIKNLRIVTPTHHQKVMFLSGGNQQKVILAKWLAIKPTLLILDQPTRGIDVGAKKEIYEIIHSLAKEGHGIVVISDEIQEILGLSDKIVVMREGRIKEIISKSGASQKQILQIAYGEDEGR